MTQEPKREKSQKPTLKQLLLSTLGAAIGVQSDNIREADFQQKSPLPYIVCGIVFTVLFVLSLIWIVSLVIEA